MSKENSIRIMILTEASDSIIKSVLKEVINKNNSVPNQFNIHFEKKSHQAKIDGSNAPEILTFIGTFASGAGAGIAANMIYDLAKKLRGKKLSIDSNNVEFTEEKIQMIAKIVEKLKDE